MTIEFDEVTAKFFRVVFYSSHPFRERENWNVQVAEIALLSREQRAKGTFKPRAAWDHRLAVDVSKFADEKGQLNWEAPAGR